MSELYKKEALELLKNNESDAKELISLQQDMEKSLTCNLSYNFCTITSMNNPII